MKIIGIIPVAAAPFCAGLVLSLSAVNSPRELEGFISLVAFYRYRMNSYLSRQAEIFAQFENEALEKCGFLAALRNTELSGEQSILSSALEKHGRLLSIDRTSMECLREFADSLGKLGLAEQTERCRFCEEELKRAAAACRTQAMQKSKLYRTLGAAAGLFFAILLI